MPRPRESAASAPFLFIPFAASQLIALMLVPRAYGRAPAVPGFSLGTAYASSFDVGSRLPVHVGTLANLQGQTALPGKFGEKGFFFELALRFATISYSANDQNRTGTYFAATTGAGYLHDIGSGWAARAGLNLVPYSTLIVASRSSAEVNGKTVKHSSLSRFEGGLGLQEKVAFEKKLPLFGWDFFGTFIAFSHLQHTYAKRSDETLISDADLRVKTKVSDSTKARLKMIMVDCGITMEF